jgi:oxygen-independent coproporphyrinogen-3 oxidase
VRPATLSAEPVAIDLQGVEAMLPRYEVAGPRYTSYPTAPVWNEAYGPEGFRCDLAEAGARADEGLSLYVHVPFCESLCHFCACNRVITRKPELPVRYLEVIEREVASIREAVSVVRPATQQHWGGGTPTHLTPEQVRRLFGTVTEAFPMRAGAEISIEVDPRVTTAEHVAALRECEFNRISMGVQDFDPHVQEAIHRVQPVEMTAKLVEIARDAGFASVAFDLIYGLPFQTPESFQRTLDAVIEISPDRIALYSYAHVTWLAKQQRGFERKDLPDGSTKLRVFLGAVRSLLEAGYVYIGLDHFARPEDELTHALRNRTLRRNFMGYTTQAGVDLIAFGPSGISQLRASYAQSQRDLAEWERAVLERGLGTMRGYALSPEDQARRWIISRIMCHGEVRAAEYQDAFGEEFQQRYAPEFEQLEPMEADGVVIREPEGDLFLTPLGRLFARNVAMIFDAYLPEQQRAAKPLFSKTV